MLLSASQKNNADEVLRLLTNEGVPPSHSNVVGQTALHISALWGTVESMQVLINAGANVDAQNQIAKMTPLHCAIRGTFQSFAETHSRRVQCVKLLLKAGADVKLCDMKGKNAFESIDDAIQETQMRNMGNIEAEMKDMREALGGAGVNMSPLALYIETLDAEGVKDYLDGGEDDLADDDGGVSRVEMNKGLLAVVQKFRSFVDDNSTDLEYKLLRDMIHCLLEAGADPNSHPMISETPSPLEEAPLHIISSSICSTSSITIVADVAAEIIKDLLSHGAKISSVTMDLLPRAAHRGKLDAVKFLTESVGVNPNFRGRQGMTSLILSSRSGKTEVVQLLLENDSVDVGITDDAGKKAIDYASTNGKEEVVSLLLERS